MPHSKLPYIWIPGQGPKAEALGRLHALVPERPAAAPGEAWLMGDDRRFFAFLLEHPVDQLPADELDHFLFDIVGGLESFKDAHAEVDAWLKWLDYLWPRLLGQPISTWGEKRAVEMLFTVVMRVLTARGSEGYAGYRRDVLDTLGLLPMRADLWNDDNHCTIAEFAGWPTCNGIISAAISLSLALLEADEVTLWTQSILAVESPFYRANILTWLVEAGNLLKAPGEEMLSALVAENGPRSIQWQHCFLLAKAPLLVPQANREIFLRTVRQDMAFEKVLHWNDSFDAATAASVKSAKIVERFVDEVLR